VHVDIQAFSGERNQRQGGALLVALGGRGLSLMLSANRMLGHALHCLLTLAAGRTGTREQQRKKQKPATN
jgi:hypothetical protein